MNRCLLFKPVKGCNPDLFFHAYHLIPSILHRLIISLCLQRGVEGRGQIAALSCLAAGKRNLGRERRNKLSNAIGIN